MRRVSQFTRRGSAYDSTMTPMIDVVFLLLVFFVWTASFQIVEYRLPSQLSVQVGTNPESTLTPPPPENDFDDIVVRVRWAGDITVWTVNDSLVSGREELVETLVRIAKIRRDTPVIIHPDPEVPLGVVLDAYDAARKAGFDEVQYAVREALQ